METERCGMVGRKMGPQDVRVLTPGICDYISLHGKGELRLLTSRR